MRLLTTASVLLILATAIVPMAAEVKGNLIAAEPLVLSPPASAAPSGSWSYVASYGYMWMPSAMTEAEWAPWDPWWAMPYGRWAWASGLGWGWTPLLPPWDMSPLGWGYDSWYGGWYGIPDPFGIPCYGWSVVPNPRTGGSWGRLGLGRDAVRPKRARLVAVVAAPPRSLALTPPMRDPRDRTEPAMRGSGRGDGRGAGVRGARGGPGSLHGGGRGGSRVEPWSLGGGISASRGVPSGGKKLK